MQLEDNFDFLSPDDIRIKGHRIGIESVLYEYIFRARTPEEIADIFPSLSLEQILATLLYYQRNKVQVDAYLAEWIEFGERMRAEQARNPTPAMLRLRKLKAEREAATRESHELQPA
jgi:uncharacterized protein (DUF433 family)